MPFNLIERIATWIVNRKIKNESSGSLSSDGQPLLEVSDIKALNELRDVDSSDIPRYPPFVKGIPSKGVVQIMATQTDLIKKLRSMLSIGDDFDRIVLPVIRNYCAFVHLLPASAKHHHRGAGGLFRHGLEVALECAFLSEGKIYSTKGTPRERRESKLRWQVASVLCGLLHDVAKPTTDVTVTNESGSVEWNPHVETLEQFLVTNQLERYFIHWVEDRHKRHERHTPIYVKSVMTNEALTYLREVERETLDDFMEALGGVSATKTLAKVMIEGDRRSVSRDLKSHHLASENFEYGVPVDVFILDAIRELVKSGKWVANAPRSPLWVLESGLFIEWPIAHEDIKKQLQHSNIPGVPNNSETIADILIEKGVAEPKVLDENNPDVYYRQWKIAVYADPELVKAANQSNESFMIDENEVYELFALKISDPHLVYRNTTEPKTTIGDVIVADERNEDDDAFADDGTTVEAITVASNDIGLDETNSQPALQLPTFSNGDKGANTGQEEGAAQQSSELKPNETLSLAEISNTDVTASPKETKATKQSTAKKSTPKPNVKKSNPPVTEGFPSFNSNPKQLQPEINSANKPVKGSELGLPSFNDSNEALNNTVQPMPAIPTITAVNEKVEAKNEGDGSPLWGNDITGDLNILGLELPTASTNNDSNTASAQSSTNSANTDEMLQSLHDDQVAQGGLGLMLHIDEEEHEQTEQTEQTEQISPKPTLELSSKSVSSEPSIELNDVEWVSLVESGEIQLGEMVFLKGGRVHVHSQTAQSYNKDVYETSELFPEYWILKDAKLIDRVKKVSKKFELSFKKEMNVGRNILDSKMNNTKTEPSDPVIKETEKKPLPLLTPENMSEVEDKVEPEDESSTIKSKSKKKYSALEVAKLIVEDAKNGFGKHVVDLIIKDNEISFSFLTISAVGEMYDIAPSKIELALLNQCAVKTDNNRLFL